jgi:ribosomal protein S18 acetylase RimI-like enzyme
MIVDKSRRRRGIGRALYAHLEKSAHEVGCAQIILVTEASREDACGFYEAMGFHPDKNKGYKKL